MKKIENKKSLIKRATMFSMLAAFTIISIKVVAWVMTDSLSLLTSLVDSTLDLTASFVTFMAVRYSLQPADEDHRFGHGKAEDIASFAQAAFIAGSGLFIVVEAVSRFINPHKIENGSVGIVVMLIASVITVMLLLFQRYVIKHTNSNAVKADSLHYYSDLLVNAIVILSFILNMYVDLPLVDPILAIIIAIYIFKSAWSVGRGAFDNLMDREFSDEDRQKIVEAVLANSNSRGMHDLRTRLSGITPFIQFHLELDGAMTLKEAHKISDKIEAEILEIFPHAEVFIHQDIEYGEDVPVELGRVVPVEKR